MRLLFRRVRARGSSALDIIGVIVCFLQGRNSFVRKLCEARVASRLLSKQVAQAYLKARQDRLTFQNIVLVQHLHFEVHRVLVHLLALGKRSHTSCVPDSQYSPIFSMMSLVFFGRRDDFHGEVGRTLNEPCERLAFGQPLLFVIPSGARKLAPYKAGSPPCPREGAGGSEESRPYFPPNFL